jgi:hypothetical protein
VAEPHVTGLKAKVLELSWLLMPAWLIDRLPPRFQTRRGFAAMLSGVAFFGYSGYNLFERGYNLGIALLFGCLSAAGVFIFLWIIFRNMSGFEDS